MLQHNKEVSITLIWLWWLTCHLHGAVVVADPQTVLINQGCSSYNETNLKSFFANINGTFLELRSDIMNQSKHFGTAKEARGETITYTMFQCRNYLSQRDCLACFNTATIQIRNCSDGNGARVIYDGCFLRYESNIFFSQTTEPGNGVQCGNKTAKGGNAFSSAAQQALMNLQTATPKINGFYAATKTQLPNNVGAIYAVAQCVETATQSDCLACMNVGYNNLQTCLPHSDGRAYDAGCFMRYSQTPFFADNQTIDITPYVKQGGSSKKWAIIGGVGGGVALVVIVLALFAWYRHSKKPKRVPSRAVKRAEDRRADSLNPPKKAGWAEVLEPPYLKNPPNPHRLTRGLRRAKAGRGGLARRFFFIFYKYIIKRIKNLPLHYPSIAPSQSPLSHNSPIHHSHTVTPLTSQTTVGVLSHLRRRCFLLAPLALSLTHTFSHSSTHKSRPRWRALLPPAPVVPHRGSLSPLLHRRPHLSVAWHLFWVGTVTPVIASTSLCCYCLPLCCCYCLVLPFYF